MRYQARRDAQTLRPEAERLVEDLWRQKKNPDEIAEALLADRTLSEPKRHAALRALLKRTMPAEAIPGNERGRRAGTSPTSMRCAGVRTSRSGWRSSTKRSPALATPAGAFESHATL
jgi:hypothetical protein